MCICINFTSRQMDDEEILCDKLKIRYLQIYMNNMTKIKVSAADFNFNCLVLVLIKMGQVTLQGYDVSQTTPKPSLSDNEGVPTSVKNISTPWKVSDRIICNRVTTG